MVSAVTGVLSGRRALVLSGAGLSTDSGIPDYRGPDSPRRTPMTYQRFLSGAEARRRYWARSHLGWARIAEAAPNTGHRAVAALERAGAVTGVITQNVDGLHQAAGSLTVVDLHGSILAVACLCCRDRTSRAALQERLSALNPGFGADRAADQAVEAAPDGDAALNAVAGFRLATCLRCGGPLKPDVVFFGENVPRPRIERCFAMVDDAEALLVAGSSLTVASGYRLVRHAYRRDIPVVIVNRGETRGDPLAALKVDGGCSPALDALAGLLAPRRAGPHGAVWQGAGY